VVTFLLTSLLFPLSCSIRRRRIRAAGFEPAISCSQGRRITKLSYTLSTGWLVPSRVSRKSKVDRRRADRGFPALLTPFSALLLYFWPRCGQKLAREGVEPSSPP
jgi:hypothetical protein